MSTTGPLLGVLGGMGPAATADFLMKLVEETPAGRDQEHIPVLAASIPQIPDRSATILTGGPSPLAAMARSRDILLAAGAGAIAIPCNTAHHWYAPLQAESAAPILHIVDAVITEIARRGRAGTPVGLLATAGTLAARVYDGRLAAAGHALVLPTPTEQALVTDLIRAVKAGEGAGRRAEMAALVEALAARGAGAVVLGCTELPLLVDRDDEGVMIDATRALARACVAWSRNGG
jgi:aspartate racemase